MRSSAAPIKPARRGQPLIVLGALLLGWIGLRAVLWEGIGSPHPPASAQAAVAKVLPQAVTAKEPPLPARSIDRPGRPAAPAALADAVPPAAPVLPPFVRPEPAPLPEFISAGPGFDSPRVAAAHQLAWMAGVAQLPVPSFVINRPQPGEQTAGLLPREARLAREAPLTARRWSADTWLLLRKGGAGVTATGLPSPSYGASQAGGVLRYRLAPGNSHRPALYLRATSAVQAPRGEEAALGFSARPLARLPVALQAELRATRQVSGVKLRPAAGAVTELPRFALPAGLSGEAYGQAGYVGGPDGTAFVDGQMRIERRVARLGDGELRAGLGAWGGAQKGASRLDIGPSATLDFRIGSGQGRVSADWRLRTAGNAAPRSGPALTLSAGF